MSLIKPLLERIINHSYASDPERAWSTKRKLELAFWYAHVAEGRKEVSLKELRRLAEELDVVWEMSMNGRLTPMLKRGDLAKIDGMTGVYRLSDRKQKNNHWKRLLDDLRKEFSAGALARISTNGAPFGRWSWPPVAGERTVPLLGGDIVTILEGDHPDDVCKVLTAHGPLWVERAFLLASD